MKLTIIMKDINVGKFQSSTVAVKIRFPFRFRTTSVLRAYYVEYNAEVRLNNGSETVQINGTERSCTKVKNLHVRIKEANREVWVI